MSDLSKQKSFFDLYIEGNALPDEIDDFVDVWHEKYEGMPEVWIDPLYKFLGLTEEEYDVWLNDANCLPQILKARTLHLPLDDVVNERITSMAIAARTSNDTALHALRKWAEKRLKQTDQ